MYKLCFKIFFISIILTFSHRSFAGIKQCESHLGKLRNIQSQQRQGHSLKRGESLNRLEAKARKIWWQCEQGHLKKEKVGKKTKKKNKKNKQQLISAASFKDSLKVHIKPFKMSSPLVMKSRYQGKKLQAWLQYYQQPKKCLRPKTTKQFAFCVENRRNQQLAFEKVDATVSLK